MYKGFIKCILLFFSCYIFFFCIFISFYRLYGNYFVMRERKGKREREKVGESNFFNILY